MGKKLVGFLFSTFSLYIYICTAFWECVMYVGQVTCGVWFSYDAKSNHALASQSRALLERAIPGNIHLTRVSPSYVNFRLENPAYKHQFP